MTADIDRYRNTLRDEMDGAALYTALAAAELDSTRKDLQRLSAMRASSFLAGRLSSRANHGN